jgi:hypothetical protein
LMWELLDRRVASATTSSLRDRLRRPARAVLAGDHAGQPTSLQANAVPGYKPHAGAVCLTPFAPAPLPDAHSIPAESQPKQKAHRKGELFALLVETAGIEPASASPLQIVLHT